MLLNTVHRQVQKRLTKQLTQHFDWLHNHSTSLGKTFATSKQYYRGKNEESSTDDRYLN